MPTVVANPYYCEYDGNTRLTATGSFSLPDMTTITTGVPQICYNNIYRPFCASAVNQDVADYFCLSYSGGNQYLVLVVLVSAVLDR